MTILCFWKGSKLSSWGVPERLSPVFEIKVVVRRPGVLTPKKVGGQPHFIFVGGRGHPASMIHWSIHVFMFFINFKSSINWLTLKESGGHPEIVTWASWLSVGRGRDKTPARLPGAIRFLFGLLKMSTTMSDRASVFTNDACQIYAWSTFRQLSGKLFCHGAWACPTGQVNK